MKKTMGKTYDKVMSFRAFMIDVVKFEQKYKTWLNKTGDRDKEGHVKSRNDFFRWLINR